MKIMIAVTHLLGVGHLSRAAALGRAFHRAGHRVVLVTGGRPAPNVNVDGLTVVQLPSVHVIGTDFKTLYGADGAPVSSPVLDERRAKLVDVFMAEKPDALIVELFPFGRRQLKSEFSALLDAATAAEWGVAVVSSIRDVLNPTEDQKKVGKTLDQLGHWFDGVLVHSDAEVLTLDASFPVSPALSRRLFYTGYVQDAAAAVPTPAASTGEIVVSGGGSAASLPLMHAALAAATGDERSWRLLVGHGVDEKTFAELQASAPGNAVVERVRSDFAALLRGARCSVSLFGYNTALDLADANVPAVVVPFDAGNEREQSIRAAKFAEMGLVQIVTSSELSGDRLRSAVDAAIRHHAPNRRGLDCRGAERSVEQVERLVTEKRRDAAALAHLNQVLNQADDAGATITFWWRDDDAVADTASLDQLELMASTHNVPVALAVIPRNLDASLARKVEASETFSILVHGIAHKNNATAGQKKQELVVGDDATFASLISGRDQLIETFGKRALPVLVPPWNRVSAEITGGLHRAGLAGWSGYADHVTDAVLSASPTHLDPIDWKAGGGLVAVGPFIERLVRLIGEARAIGPAAQPIGLLTHHLVHDAWIWAFLDGLLKTLRSHRCVRFIAAKDVFSLT